MKIDLLAKKIVDLIDKKPCVIFLQGNLGVGKTTLAQSIIQKIQNKTTIVTSPTYSYMNIYRTDPPIYHFDLYRIEKPQSLEELGLLEYLNDSSAIRLIEWPEKALSFLPSPDLEILLHFCNSKRSAVIKTKSNQIIQA